MFLELPNYVSGDDPEETIDGWAYFFREAENLAVVPPALSVPPYREALKREEGHEGGRWEGHDAGLLQGRAEGLREAIRALGQALEIEIDAEREVGLASLGAGELKELQARLLRERNWS